MNRESVPVESETLGQEVSVAQVVELLVSSKPTGPLFRIPQKRRKQFRVSGALLISKRIFPVFIQGLLQVG